ncbi:MAG: hypothetical protein IJW34_00610 [Clostridia bacterium]|nr:hypothetical protein [Clostridia bacterium]
MPHIVLKDDPERRHWSIRFPITEDNRCEEGFIEFTMLADNAEALSYFRTLQSGAPILLLEGNTEVARGYMV